MRPTEPLERAWSLARRALSPRGTGAAGDRVQPLPWGTAPVANPERIVRAVHETGIRVPGGCVAPRDRCDFDRDARTGERWSGPALSESHDARSVWELGRLQHLALLAAADPHDPTPRDDARELRRRHPVGQGLPWASTLEVALRLVSLAQIVARWPVPDLRHAIAEHAQWLMRWPSLGSSARNHRIAELGALAVAAWVLPDAADRDRWRRESEGLPAVLHHQLHRDGVGIEQSTHYLAFVLEWCMVARSVGIEGLDAGMISGVRFLSRLVDPSGASIRIGDDDDGRVVACTVEPEPHYVTSVTGAAAALLGEPPPRGWRPDRRAGLLSAELPERRLDPGSTWFPVGGLTVLRDHGRVVAMDHGPLGEPDLGAHGHADALAVWVHLDSGPVVVSRGTGLYQGDTATRRFHRGSSAQPTVVVDGLPQSQPHEHPFLWRSRARASVHELDLDDGIVAASHDGYVERLGVIHRRRIRNRTDALIVEDALLGTGTHHITIQLPLAPELSVALERGRWTVRDGARALLVVEPDPRCSVRIASGGPIPGIGQHSTTYGQWSPATTIRLEHRGRVPVELCTILRFGVT